GPPRLPGRGGVEERAGRRYCAGGGTRSVVQRAATGAGDHRVHPGHHEAVRGRCEVGSPPEQRHPPEPRRLLRGGHHLAPPCPGHMRTAAVSCVSRTPRVDSSRRLVLISAHKLKVRSSRGQERSPEPFAGWPRGHTHLEPEKIRRRIYSYVASVFPD